MVFFFLYILLDLSFIFFKSTGNGYKRLDYGSIENKSRIKRKINFEILRRSLYNAERKIENSLKPQENDDDDDRLPLLTKDDSHSYENISLVIDIFYNKNCFIGFFCLIKDKNCNPRGYLICLTLQFGRKYNDEEERFELQHQLKRIYLLEIQKRDSTNENYKRTMENLLSLSDKGYITENGLKVSKVIFKFIGFFDKEGVYNSFSFSYSKNGKNPKIDGKNEATSSFNLFNNMEFRYLIKIENFGYSEDGKTRFRVVLNKRPSKIIRQYGLEESRQIRILKKMNFFEFEMKSYDNRIMKIFKNFESGLKVEEESPFEYSDCDEMKFSEKNVENEDRRDFTCFKEGVDLSIK